MIKKSSKIIMIVSITLASIAVMAVAVYIGNVFFQQNESLTPAKIVDTILGDDNQYEGIESSSGIDGFEYTCFDKVYISAALADRYQDGVYMKVTDDKNNENFDYEGDENKVISGKINALYKFDKTVVVLCDDVYYVIDTDKYTTPQKFEEGKHIDYKPAQYSEKEYKSKYPDYKSYECFYSRSCEPVVNYYD